MVLSFHNPVDMTFVFEISEKSLEWNQEKGR